MNTSLSPLHQLAGILTANLDPDRTSIVGITGSVAAGKSTLAAQLSEALNGSRMTETVSSDGFLFANDVLEARSILSRKGFPESFDQESLIRALASIRLQPTLFPAYSHDTYNVDPALARSLPPGGIVLIEGLGLPPPGSRQSLDLLIYIDAEEEDLQHWYIERFLNFWRAAPNNPHSFYRRFLHLDEEGVTALARSVWSGVNLPNLRENILPVKRKADIVIHKDRSHGLVLQRVP